MQEIITFLTEYQSESLWVLTAIITLSLIITYWSQLKF